MEELIEDLTRGNVTEVKVVLASIVAALAVNQVLLMAVGYGKLRLPNGLAGHPPNCSFGLIRRGEVEEATDTVRD